MRAAKGLVTNQKQVERKFSVKNDRVDTLNEDFLENEIRIDRIHSTPYLDDNLEKMGKTGRVRA